MYCTHLLIMWNPNVRNLLSLLIACRFHATKMTQNNISPKMLFKKCFQKYACTKSNDFDHICCSLPLPKCTYPSIHYRWRVFLQNEIALSTKYKSEYIETHRAVTLIITFKKYVVNWQDQLQFSSFHEIMRKLNFLGQLL